MSLDESAVRLLGNTAIEAADTFNKNAPANSMVIPNTHVLVDLQKFEPTKRRFSGKLSTSDLPDFIGYTKAHKGAEGFIDADNLACAMFFNLGNEDTPGHADWLAVLKLKKTAAFNALLSINGHRLEQMELSNWLEDWIDFLAPIARAEGSTYGTIGKAIQAVRQITMKAISENDSKVGDFAASRTAIEEIEAQSKVELPAGFDFACEPYSGLPLRTFRVRLQVLTSSKEPILVLRIVQLEAQQEAIARDFKALLQGELADDAKLTIGTFNA